MKLLIATLFLSLQMRISLSFALTVFFILIFLFLLARFIWRDTEARGYFTHPYTKIMRLFHHHHSSDQQTHVAAISSGIQPPTVADVTRYRYHHGANLGSVFVLERWLAGYMFPSSTIGTSELAAVQAWLAAEGPDNTRLRFEKHWREYISDADLDWLGNVARCTTVRLPIGYFTLGPHFCEGTPFKPVAAVYQNAWACVQDLIHRCNQRGIGVLVDLHGLPGGANTGEHSGTNSGKAEFWTSKSYLDLATRCVCFIAQQVRTMEGVAGIQIVNEAERDAKGMYEWYEKVLHELSHIDVTIPVYVSDAWNLGRALSWSQHKNAPNTTPVFNPIVIDTHLYWCFGDQDMAKAPHQLIYEVPTSLSALDGKDGSVVDRGAAQAFVGEYSCVLAEQTWGRRRTDTPKTQLVRDFGVAQSQRFQSRAAGATFWTYRMDWMPGGEWGFRAMHDANALALPPFLFLAADDIRARLVQAQSQREARRSSTVASHTQYWDKNFPGHYEHWRFDAGWDVGFADAAAFFGMRATAMGRDGGDKIGMLDLWVLKRLREAGQAGAAFAWEWEMGLRQGVRDFGELVGA